MTSEEMFELHRLRAENKRLREALEVLSDHYKSRYGDCTRGGVISAVEQIARAALKENSNG